MSDLIFSLEVAVGLLVAVAGGYLLAMTVRRRAIARGKLTTLCAHGREGSHAWRPGFIRFGEGDVEWFPLNALSMRPRHIWSRRGLDLGPPSPLAAGEGVAGLQGGVVVRCDHHGTAFRLALAEAAYTALRSWVESAPPESASAVN